ncbi:hypothetical protein IWX65_002952 [Arthrobacter sp. CAN_A214]
MIFNLPGYRVLSAVAESFGQRRITVESTDPPAARPVGSSR